MILHQDKPDRIMSIITWKNATFKPYSLTMATTRIM
jgi:hypothetical protein